METDHHIKIISKIRWKWVFVLTGLLYLIFLVWAPVMPTLDGAMHLHNAHMLGVELSEGLKSDLIERNPSGWINVADHIVLIGMSFLFGPLLGQKMLLALIFVAGAIGWWRLFCTSSLNGAWSLSFFSIWIGWPWFMGFFNFLLGATLLLYLVPLILKKEVVTRDLVWLAAGATLLAVLHLYVFATAGLLAVSSLLFQANSKSFFRKWWRRLSPFVPGSIFLVTMLAISNSASRELAFTTMGDKAMLLFSGQVLKGLDPGKEGRFAMWVGIAVVLQVFVGIYLRFSSSKQHSTDRSYWVFCGASLVLLFVIPDHVGAGSFLPYRVVFFFSLFLFLALATLRTSIISSFLVMTGLTIANLGFLFYYGQFLPAHGILAEELYEVSDEIQTGAVVLSLASESHWMHEHFSAYLGLNEELILLDNYELSSGAFPLKLSENHQYMIGRLPVQAIPCHTITFPLAGKERQVDYVLLMDFRNEPRACEEALLKLSREGYRLMEKKDGFLLYQKKAAHTDGLEGVQDK